MKKLILSVAVIATMAMASCSTTEKAKDEGLELKSKIENCSNPDSLKVYVEQAKAYADKLIKEGKDSAAQVYLQEVAPVIEAKDPAAKSLFQKIESAADSVAADVKDAAANASDSISAKASDIKDAVADKAAAAKEAASDKAAEVKEAAAKATADTKEKAADAAQKAADKVKEALNK